MKFIIVILILNIAKFNKYFNEKIIECLNFIDEIKDISYCQQKYGNNYTNKIITKYYIESDNKLKYKELFDDINENSTYYPIIYELKKLYKRNKNNTNNKSNNKNSNLDIEYIDIYSIEFKKIFENYKHNMTYKNLPSIVNKILSDNINNLSLITFKILFIIIIILF